MYFYLLVFDYECVDLSHILISSLVYVRKFCAVSGPSEKSYSLTSFCITLVCECVCVCIRAG